MLSPPSAKTAEWTSDDAIALRNFLESVAGQRALVHIGEGCAELLAGGDINAILIRSGEVKGYSAALVNLISLTVEVPQSTPPEKPHYPSLDDDSAWDEKTNTPK